MFVLTKFNKFVKFFMTLP